MTQEDSPLFLLLLDEGLHLWELFLGFERHDVGGYSPQYLVVLPGVSALCQAGLTTDQDVLEGC